jgi:hypothetical protein
LPGREAAPRGRHRGFAKPGGSQLKVLVNHVGYEIEGPKRFVVRTDENLGPSGHFEIIDGTGRKALEGSATRAGAAEADGPFYYVGDFSALHYPGGDFQVRFEAGNRLATSARFGVGQGILWQLTKPLVLHYMRRSRAGKANYAGAGEWTPPGSLKGDEHFYDVAGGWFDRGGRGGSSIDLGVRAILAFSFAGARSRRDPQIADELRWGAEWLRRLMVKHPDSGLMIARADENGRLRALGPRAVAEPHVGLLAGFLYARLSEILGDVDLLRRGELFWKEYHGKLAGLDSIEATAAMLVSEVSLHVALLEPRYLASAERRAKSLLAKLTKSPRPETRFAAWESPGVSLPAAALVHFAEALPDNPLTPRAKEAVGDFLDARVEATRSDPFGLLPHAVKVAPEELAMRRAEEAWQALFAYRVTGRPAYVEFATRALDWLLGVNPEDECLLRGAGIRKDSAAGSGEGDGAIISAPGAPPESAHLGSAAAYLTALSLL